MMAVLEASIAEKLPSLSKDELRELITRATFLADPNGSGTKAAPSDKDQVFVYGEIETTLKAAGDRSGLPLRTLLRQNWARSFKEGVPVILTFIREEFKPKDQVELTKVLRILLRCMVADLRRRSVPVGPKTVSQQLCRVSQVVDYSFPNYLACNMLHLVLKRAG